MKTKLWLFLTFCLIFPLVFQPNAALAAPAMVQAKNSNSLGKGVKCSWVLVSSTGSNNVYQQICRKSGV